jgi:hypothetical protein
VESYSENPGKEVVQWLYEKLFLQTEAKFDGSIIPKDILNHFLTINFFVMPNTRKSDKSKDEEIRKKQNSSKENEKTSSKGSKSDEDSGKARQGKGSNDMGRSASGGGSGSQTR